MKKLDKMILLSLSLTLLLQSNALAEEKKIERIYGKDRYETSIKVADALSSSLEKVIVASGEMFPDALAGSVLTSGKYPIVLASKDRLDPSVRAKISKAKEVYILGGSETISSAVENDIKSLGAKVSRLSGMDRYETSVKIAQVTGSKDLILVNGDLFPDSLTASGIALLNNRSILLVKSNEMPQSVKDYIKKINPSSITIIGGSKSVDDRLEKESKLFTNNVKRISGRDRYETSLEVAKQFTNLKNLVVASGDNFTDALSASSIAGKLKAPMLLVDGKRSSETVAYIEKNKKNIDSIKVVGGPNTVSDSTFKSISNVVETKDSKKEEDKKVLGTVIKPNKDKPSPEKPNQENPKLADKPADGVWYGTAFEGYGTRQNGATIVKVKISDGKIESVEPIKHGGEGEEYIKKSKNILSMLKGTIETDLVKIAEELSHGDLQNKGKYADVVTTATKTAKGYVKASEKAIERAKKYKDDKKDQKVAYIKIAGNNEFDPSKDRVRVINNTKLENNKAADFNFVLYDIGMSDGRVIQNVKFSDLEKYGITSNYKQGQILNIDNNKYFIDLEVKDESGYAMEKINLNVAKGPEKKKVRPDYILVTFKDKSNKKINITSEIQYDESFDKEIEKVELYKNDNVISTGEYNDRTNYYKLEKFNNNYKLGEDETWESSIYRLIARKIEKPVDASAPHKVLIKSKDGSIVKEVHINASDWEKNNKNLVMSNLELPSDYEKKLGELNLEVFNGKNEKIEATVKVSDDSIKIDFKDSDNTYIKFDNFKFIKITDYIPAKIVVKPNDGSEVLAELKIGEEEWADGKTVVRRLDTPISEKYKMWSKDSFDIDVLNKSGQKLEHEITRSGSVFTVNVYDKKLYTGRAINITWKFVQAQMDDFLPAKVFIKEKGGSEILAELEFKENEWSDGKTVVRRLGVPIPEKYKTWKEDSFDVEVLNKSGQKIEHEITRSGSVFTVNVYDKKLYTGRAINITWAYPEAVEKDYFGHAEAVKPENADWMGQSKYSVKLKVKVKDNKILSVEDNGSDYSDFNKGYFLMASKNFEKYKDKNIDRVKNSNIGEDGIDVVTNATVTSNAIHNAVKDALNKTK